jgi:hypothetical protein
MMTISDWRFLAIFLKTRDPSPMRSQSILAVGSKRYPASDSEEVWELVATFGMTK